MLSAFLVVGGSIPFRIVSPFSESRVRRRTGDLVTHSLGATPIPSQPVADSRAPANRVDAPAGQSLSQDVSFLSF